MITIIDKLLKKNSYLKNLSVADRIAVYNEALKQVAELLIVIHRYTMFLRYANLFLRKCLFLKNNSFDNEIVGK